MAELFGFTSTLFFAHQKSFYVKIAQTSSAPQIRIKPFNITAENCKKKKTASGQLDCVLACAHINTIRDLYRRARFCCLKRLDSKKKNRTLPPARICSSRAAFWIFIIFFIRDKIKLSVSFSTM